VKNSQIHYALVFNLHDARLLVDNCCLKSIVKAKSVAFITMTIGKNSKTKSHNRETRATH